MYFGLCLVIFAQVFELLIMEGKNQHYYLIVWCVCISYHAYLVLFVASRDNLSYINVKLVNTSYLIKGVVP